MVNITYVYHWGTCPQFGIEISVSAKYRYTENPNNPYEARFCTCCVKCPIIENFKLPERKRKKEYGLYRFCRKENECELLNFPFEETIDVRYSGRVQQKVEPAPEESTDK